MGRVALAWRWPWPRLSRAPGDWLSDLWPGEETLWTRLGHVARKASAGLRRARARAGWASGPLAAALMLLAVLLVVLAGGAGTYIAVTRGAPLIQAGLSGHAANVESGVVVRAGTAPSTPTPAQPAYELGVWPSNSSPASTGEVTVYARLTGLGRGTGVGKVPITLRVTFPSGVRVYGPVRTNAYGLAAFTVTFHNLPPGRLVFVVAFAPAGFETTYTATTVFAASK